MKFRRVVTGHNREGKSVIQRDGGIETVSGRPGFSQVPVWATKELPARLTDEDPSAWKFGTTIAGGSVFRVIEYAPGVAGAVAPDGFDRLCGCSIRRNRHADGRGRDPSEGGRRHRSERNDAQLGQSGNRAVCHRLCIDRHARRASHRLVIERAAWIAIAFTKRSSCWAKRRIG